MPSIEERLTAIEHDNTELKQVNAKLQQEHAELKEKVELQTIAIGGLVNKAMLESIQEKNNQIFKVLTDHVAFTNYQLAELREKVEVELAGQVVGLQTEMRQGFNAINARFEQQEAAINARFEQQEKRLDEHTTRLDRLETTLGEHTTRLDRLETTLGEHTSLLTQILARLPEKP